MMDEDEEGDDEEEEDNEESNDGDDDGCLWGEHSSSESVALGEDSLFKNVCTD